MSNDHTVPRMYLRRFGWQQKRRSKDWFISARSIDDLERPFSANIRRVAAVVDFYGERVEKLLSKLEGDATPVFDVMLEDPLYALPRPDRWPLRVDDRVALAWWIAAQIVRTTRQRRRLMHLTLDAADQLELPISIRSLAGRDEHVRFMADQLASLSWVIFDRPWGLGFSDVCLWTSDTPVVIINGQDDANQLLATSYWDVLLPLDPHRFLILPGWHTRREDHRKQVDHLIKFDQGMGLTLSSILFEAADSHVFCHRDHDPLPHLRLVGPRLATPWTGNTQEGASWILKYPTLKPGFTVERRWLIEHPPASAG